MKTVHLNNCTIKVGENASENTLLIKKSNPKYYWVHLDSFPSGHVVVESEIYDESVIMQACILCLENTKYKHLKDVYFCVTQIKNLKLSETLGEVIFCSKRRVLRIKLDS